MFYLFNVLTTILICMQGDLMYDNVSTIAYKTDLNLFIIIYTMISAIGFAYKTYNIYKFIPNKHINITTALTAIIMILGSFMPYAPNGDDLISKTHVYASMICCISFLLHLFVFTNKLSLYYYDIYKEIHIFYNVGIEFIVLCLLFFTRINGYLEIIYSLFVCIYLYMIECQLKRHDITTSY